MIKWILLFLLTNVCFAEDPRVIILDTGLDIQDPRFINVLCKDMKGIDFTGEGLKDTIGHGTHVAGLIKQYAKDAKYCITVIKYYSEKNSGRQNLNNINSALQLIHYLKPAFVNISGGGPQWDGDEYKYIKNTPETKFIVAVGNRSTDLDEKCNYYPACYKLNNIYKVGSLDASGEIAPTSNFGNIIKYWQIGEDVKSTLPDGEEGIMSGTSMACAIQTGKMIYENAHPSCDVKSHSCTK